MIFAKLLEKCFIFIVNQIVIPNPGTNENFFHLWNFADLPKQFHIIPMVYIQIFAFCRPQALFVPTSAML